MKQYVKMSKLKITNIVKENENNQCKLVLYENGFGNCTYYKVNYFKGLELNKRYTLSELRIGGFEMNKFEVIVGIIEIIVAFVIYPLGYPNTTMVFCMWGGYHLGKGLYKERD